jgi:hypothetical protein
MLISARDRNFSTQAHGAQANSFAAVKEVERFPVSELIILDEEN